MTWWVAHETACLQGTRNGVCLNPVTYHWKYLQARVVLWHSSLRRYPIMPMIRFFETRGLISRGWDLSSADWGFECWRACRDGAIARYQMAVNGHASPAP